MKRRRFIDLGGVSFLAAASGCASVYGRFSGAPQLPDGMTVETVHWSHGLLEEGDGTFAVVVTSAAAATDEVSLLRTSREDLDPIEFIEQTDFDTSYLVVVEWIGGSSSYSLELDRITRRDFGLHVGAEVVVPNGPATDDFSPHSLVIRVTDEREDAPESVTVDVRE